MVANKIIAKYSTHTHVHTCTHAQIKLDTSIKLSTVECTSDGAETYTVSTNFHLLVQGDPGIHWAVSEKQTHKKKLTTTHCHFEIGIEYGNETWPFSDSSCSLNSTMVSSIPSHLLRDSTTSVAVRFGRPAVNVESIGSLLPNSPSLPPATIRSVSPPWWDSTTERSRTSRSCFVRLSWAISRSVLSLRSWYIFSRKSSSSRRILHWIYV